MALDDGKVCVFDPVAGGEALVVLDAGDRVFALVAFEDQATGALPRLAWVTRQEGARLRPGRGRRGALVVLEGHT